MTEECKLCTLKETGYLSVNKGEPLNLCEKHKKLFEEKKTLSDKIYPVMEGYPSNWLRPSDVGEAVKEFLIKSKPRGISLEYWSIPAKEIFGDRLL